MKITRLNATITLKFTFKEIKVAKNNEQPVPGAVFKSWPR